MDAAGRGLETASTGTAGHARTGLAATVAIGAGPIGGACAPGGEAHATPDSTQPRRTALDVTSRISLPRSPRERTLRLRRPRRQAGERAALGARRTTRQRPPQEAGVWGRLRPHREKPEEREKTNSGVRLARVSGPG